LYPEVGTSVAEGGKHVRTVRLRALYDCREMCGREPGIPDSEETTARRAACRCSLPDFDPARWDTAADKRAAGEAGSALAELEAVAHHQRYELDHDLDRDGCPWGWVVSTFATSVARYMGPRSADSPARGTSAWMLSRVAQPGPMPTRWLELVDRATAHEDNAYAYYHRVLTNR